MLKMKNCVTAIMLSVTLGVTTIPIGGIEVFAAVNQESMTYEEALEEGWNYREQEDGTLTISQYTGTNTEIVIPSEIDGKKVTGIGNFAFQFRTNLISVSIPKGVTSIGYQAFVGCSSLKNITLPEGLTVIGYGAFMGCSNLTNILIPESIVSIGDVAFNGCRSLTEITVEESNSDYASKDGIWQHCG